MEQLHYKGYTGSVEYSDEDGCYFGTVLGLDKDLILYEGDDLAALQSDFEAGIESYLAGCAAEGLTPGNR